MKNYKNILVAPLNWGLGHATRCIPVINALIENGFNPILASDGGALNLLKKEFPNLTALELPSYNIEYAKNGKNFKWKIIKNSPKTINAIFAEKRLIKKWISEYNISGIISDNRLGAYNKKIPSVFITHQIRVLTGNTSWLSTAIHKNVIKKFSQCWVPDFEFEPSLTGKLGHLDDSNLKVNHIGPLSRLEKKELPSKYDLMIILSGPEPQRTMIEEILINETQKFNGNILFVKGKIEATQEVVQLKNVTFYNYMNSADIEIAFNESDLILCRSGYTTIMDLAKLNKKAFFIPTPGQYEQEYLAKKLKKELLYDYCEQNDFKIEKLDQVTLYSGFLSRKNQINWQHLFKLFSE